jgi:hypothetical protein
VGVIWLCYSGVAMRIMSRENRTLEEAGRAKLRFKRTKVGTSEVQPARLPMSGLIFFLAFLICNMISAPAASAQATNVYITPDGSSQGICTSNQQTPSYFNNGANWGNGANQIGPGTTVNLCGTFTGAAGSTLLTFQGSGTSGKPITLLFDAGTQLNAAYWSGSGGINTNGKSFITIDGGTNGVIQNTANGDLLANRQISALINAYSCGSCTIQNLTLANVYVASQGITNVLGGAMTQMNSVTFSGSNWTIRNNVVHDCGWCLYNPYANGDTNIQVYNNEIYNWDHAYMFAAAGANSATNFYFHDNNIHDNINFETIGCVYHLDGIHFFGTNGSSMSGIYVYNNWFHGVLSGPCSSGFIFMEGGASSTPSHASNTYWWNNVFDASQTDAPNANGWVGIFSGDSGVTTVLNNTMVAANGTDMDVCYNVKYVNDLTFEDNVVNNCGIQMGLGSLTGTIIVDYNIYGNSCQNGNNCFVFNGSFEGNFATWKSALSGAGISGADAHSLYNLVPNLNMNGTPESTYIGNLWGANLSSFAAGNMASLSSSTTQAGAQTPVVRPGAGTCSPQPSTPCWTVGAYQTSGSTSGQPTPPTALIATVN